MNDFSRFRPRDLHLIRINFYWVDNIVDFMRYLIQFLGCQLGGRYKETSSTDIRCDITNNSLSLKIYNMRNPLRWGTDRRTLSCIVTGCWYTVGNDSASKIAVWDSRRDCTRGWEGGWRRVRCRGQFTLYCKGQARAVHRTFICILRLTGTLVMIDMEWILK